MGINTMWLVLTPQCGARSMGAEAPLSFWDSPYVSKKQRGRCLPLEVKFQQIKFWTQTYLKPQLQSYWVNKNAVCSVVFSMSRKWLMRKFKIWEVSSVMTCNAVEMEIMSTSRSPVILWWFDITDSLLDCMTDSVLTFQIKCTHYSYIIGSSLR